MTLRWMATPSNRQTMCHISRATTLSMHCPNLRKAAFQTVGDLDANNWWDTEHPTTPRCLYAIASHYPIDSI